MIPAVTMSADTKERKTAQKVGIVQTVTVLKNGTDIENWKRMSFGRDSNFLVT